LDVIGEMLIVTVSVHNALFARLAIGTAVVIGRTNISKQ